MALPHNKGKTLNVVISSTSIACLFKINPGPHTNPLCAVLGGCWLIVPTRKYPSKAIISVIWLLFQFCSLRSISTHEAPHRGITKSAQWMQWRVITRWAAVCWAKKVIFYKCSNECSHITMSHIIWNLKYKPVSMVNQLWLDWTIKMVFKGNFQLKCNLQHCAPAGVGGLSTFSSNSDFAQA